MNSVAGSALVSLAAALVVTVRAQAAEPEPRALAREIMGTLESFNGTTATRTIGKELERLGELGEHARPEARALVTLMEDRSPVFQGRDEHDVVRIRALALGVLARIGPPPEAALLIAEQLDESDDPRSIAAAACAFSRLPGPKKWGLRGLITALRSEMMDEPLCLERSSTEGVPFGKLTTMRLEVLGALRSLGADAREALPLVAAEAKSVARAGTFHDRIRQEAIKTLGEIEASIRKDASTAEPLCCAACAADSASLVSSPWLAAGERENVLSPSAKFTVQDGRELTWGDLTGQPTVVTFFYTHCVNPRRCDRTLALVGSLRKRLERDPNLVRSVRILCVTMEPTRDDPPALRRYARDHQMPVDDNLMFVRPALASPAALVDGLKFPVNLSGDRVNSHAVALYVLDKSGRVARTYRSLLWDPADVARDLDRLRKESETQR